MRSAGTAPSARIRVREEMLAWVNLIFVMEDRHAEQLRQRFGAAVDERKLIVLNIPDNYRYMDPELVDELRDTVGAYR